MKTPALIALLYLFVTTVCVIISTWSTYHGFVAMLGWIAIPAALVVAAGLLACDIAILDARQKGEAIAPIILVLIVFTVASAAANFNYFYSNFAKESVVEGRFVEASNKFDENFRAAETVLSGLSDLPKRRADFDRVMRNLENEVRDPLREGFGDKAREHLAQVYAQTVGAVAQPEVPRPLAAASVNEVTLKLIRERVEANLKAAEDSDRALKLLERLKTEKQAQQKEFADLSGQSGDGVARANPRIAAINRWRAVTGDLERAVRQVQTERNSEPLISMPAVSPTAIGLSTIPQSLQSGFIERPDFGATLFAGFFALLIDLFPLMMALSLVKKTEDGRILGAKPESADKVKILKKLH